jgi:RNA polymerase sigma-70 factor (ECF subfamily)
MSSPPSEAPAEADFHMLYQARYFEVLATVHALIGDLGEAQEVAQEAFGRAWEHWQQLSESADAAGWVRRIAVTLAMSRWRRLRVARRHLLRQGRPAPTPALGPDHAALVVALRALPVGQRRAVVLHHLVDLPVEQVAEEMGVAVGTVRSWLHRGRTALAAQLAETDGAQEGNCHD